MIAVIDPPPMVMPMVALLGPFVIVILTLLFSRAGDD